MDANLQLLAAVMAFEPRVHLFGGVAEDALLHGSWVRPHEDVDVLVFREDLDRHLESAAALGFDAVEVRFEPLPDAPVVVGAVQELGNLEISVYDRTPDGVPFFYMVDANDRVVRVLMPPDMFDFPPSVIDGVTVRTVSPLAQYQIRAGIAAAGGFGPLRPKDVGANEAIRARFFADADPATLEPRIVPVEQAT